MEAKEIGDVRHDLKNLMAALRSGCTLIASRLGSGAEPEVLEYLEEMCAELDRGSALLERLREMERERKGPAG